jgi:hypothetical protein
MQSTEYAEQRARGAAKNLTIAAKKPDLQGEEHKVGQRGR